MMLLGRRPSELLRPYGPSELIRVSVSKPRASPCLSYIGCLPRPRPLLPLNPEKRPRGEEQIRIGANQPMSLASSVPLSPPRVFFSSYNTGATSSCRAYDN